MRNENESGLLLNPLACSAESKALQPESWKLLKKKKKKKKGKAYELLFSVLLGDQDYNSLPSWEKMWIAGGRAGISGGTKIMLRISFTGSWSFCWWFFKGSTFSPLKGMKGPLYKGVPYQKYFGLLEEDLEIYLFFFSWPHLWQGSSQARGPVGAAAASLHHSHRNARSEPPLGPTLQLVGNARCLSPWARPGMEPLPSWILIGFLTRWATTGAPEIIF